MNSRRSLFFLSMLSFVLGTLFYIFVRGYFVSPFFSLHVTRIQLIGIFQGSFPSFAHAFAMTMLSIAFGLTRKNAIILCLVCGLVLELTQPLFSLGTFDVFDLVGVIFGAFSAGGITRRISPAAKPTHRWVETPLIVLAITTSVASSEHPPKVIGDPSPPKRGTPTPATGKPELVTPGSHEAIYMSYEELRQSFAVEPPRPIKEFGKILVLGDTLLVSEANIGVHVFNNSNPSQPVAKYFINVPGNVDLAAKGDVLYADSFVDLLAIRLGAEKPQLVQRIVNTFDWNPYQAIKDRNVSFNGTLDRQRGVVIGSRKLEEGPTK